jgi:hypothetical protein
MVRADDFAGEAALQGSLGQDLIAAIEEFLKTWNENPRPFVWTATVESITAKLSGCRQTLEQIQPGYPRAPEEAAETV